jgi:hypothetical protein
MKIKGTQEFRRKHVQFQGNQFSFTGNTENPGGGGDPTFQRGLRKRLVPEPVGMERLRPRPEDFGEPNGSIFFCIISHF